MSRWPHCEGMPYAEVIGDSDIIRHAVEMFRLPACRPAMLPGTTHTGIPSRAGRPR